MIDKRYGKIFHQIREQKQLPLSYFEKYGILKSNLARFERGETMMGFERINIMLQAMNVNLSDYELFLNYYFPDYQEHFLFELEQAELLCGYEKVQKLYEEVKFSEHKFLVLSAKSKLEKLNMFEVNEILNYLKGVQHWGCLELTLNSDIVEYIEAKEIKMLVENFKKNSGYYNITKYKRRIHQIAYKAVLNLCQKGEQEYANEVLSLTNSSDGEGLDFYMYTLRNFTTGCMKYCFENVKCGIEEINHALELFEELGNKQLRNYYSKKINSFIDI